MALHNVNLNLLPVLRELLNRRSITLAAAILGRSPSAVSQGLSQLRSIFDDPLLVRAGGGMVLTLRAEELIGSVEDAYAQIERVLRVEGFDPAHAERQFVVAATDFDVFTYGPAIVSAIRAAAPSVQLRFVDVGRDLDAQIISREIDLAVLPDFLLIDLASDRMLCHPVGESETVALMRAGHPTAAAERIDREALRRWGHIAFLPTWEVVGRRSALVANRQPSRAVAILPHIVLVPSFVANTDHIALVPEMVAARLGRAMGLIYLPLDFNEPLIRSVVAWGRNQQADPAHRWLRGATVQAARSAQGNPAIE